MLTVGIIGATGYVGAELLRLLLSHPHVEKLYVSSISFEGQQMEDIYANFFNCLNTKCDGVLKTAEEVVSLSDVIFTALPHGVAETWADVCIKSGKKLIDLSADFRFDKDEDTFKKWYKKSWDFPEIHAEAVYGLPETHRDCIKKARIIGNPGCYVTSATLALIPALKNDCISTDMIIIDSKSGVTGAGRTPTMTNHFCECGESFTPYAVGNHRHQPEIQHNLEKFSGKSCTVIFTPHLLPMNRGIVSTIYTQLKQSFSIEEIHAQYTEFYKNEHFVRVLPLGMIAKTKNVRYSNFCDISVHLVNDGKMLQIIASLDNMIKGAAGQAIQNMNLLYDFDETSGLDLIPPTF